MEEKLLDIDLSNDFFLGLTPKAQATSGQVRLYLTKKYLHSKRNNQQNEKTSYRMGDNIC